MCFAVALWTGVWNGRGITGEWNIKSLDKLVSREKYRVAVMSAKNHKRQRRKCQSVTAKREKSPKVLTEILTLPNLT